LAALCLALAPSSSAVAASTVAGAVACGPVVTEPLVEPPWPLTRLRPDLAWPLTRGAGVTVAVIDSGVSAEHPSLRGSVLPGTDFVNSAAGPGQCDENGHGTLIAGLIAGRETISAGFRFHGVAPEARIVPIRVLRDQRRSFEDDLSLRIATAIRWAVDVGRADVINRSLTTLPTPQLEAAIRHAVDRRVVVVAAAGNEGQSGQPGQPAYPAAYDGVIGVASIGTADEHVDSSSTGTFVDVAAPGVRIAGPSPTGGGFLFSEEGGTSFAAGYVSGVAALVRAYHPDLTPDQVTARITQTAEHPPDRWNPRLGYGVVNPARAVGALQVAVAPPPVLADGIRPQAAPTAAEDAPTVAAAWIVAIGATVVVVILAAVPVTRRGRQRRWRIGPL
jgi:type VII secretion-associated serine protease mycosin